MFRRNKLHSGFNCRSWLRNIYYRSRFIAGYLVEPVKQRFNPLLSIGDVKIIFNGRETSFVHYVYGADFARLRRMCLKISSYLSQLKPNLFIDAGASYGIFSILINSFYLSDIPTICVEPDSRVFPFLKKNIKNAGLKNCRVIWGMVGDVTGEKLFQENLLGSVDSRGADIGQIDVFKETKVHCFRIDDLIEMQSHGVVKESIFIKIDTQGMDMDVLRGASMVLESAKKAIVVLEFVPTMLKEEPEEIFDLFKNLGFSFIINLGESNIEWLDNDNSKVIKNYDQMLDLYNKLTGFRDGYTNLMIAKGLDVQ